MFFGGVDFVWRGGFVGSVVLKCVRCGVVVAVFVVRAFGAAWIYHIF